MLKLRRGVVVTTDPLIVEVDGEERPAWADRSLVGEAAEGDEVIVNTEALDLGLGSGGFDVVHVNLTRGLGGGGTRGERVMKLNYTSLQHAVEPVEVGGRDALMRSVVAAGAVCEQHAIPPARDQRICIAPPAGRGLARLDAAALKRRRGELQRHRP